VAFNGKVAKEAGFFEDRNKTHRRFMEDAKNLIPQFGDQDWRSYFGVYDGHAGAQIARYCEANLPKILVDELKILSDEDHLDPAKVGAAFSATYAKLDEATKTYQNGGACIATALLCRFGDRRVVHVANAGDTRIVLVRKGEPIRLTKDHKPSDDDEKQRILAEKGFIDEDGRVNGILGVSRAIGDHLMKGPGKNFISGEPFLHSENLTDDDSFLILACDGIWDVVSEQQAAEIVVREADKESKLVARTLLGTAIKSGTTDNVTVIVVKLK